jgi:signal recognition particle subunit SEC65
LCFAEFLIYGIKYCSSFIRHKKLSFNPRLILAPYEDQGGRGKNLNFVKNHYIKILFVEIESTSKAKELSSMLSSMNFVKKVSSFSNPKAIIALLQEHENIKKAIVKKKNKAIAKYLSSVSQRFSL